jgi:hypothetical protein
MLDTAQAEVIAADTSPARVALQRAERDLAEAHNREAFAALTLRARQLDDALCRCVGDLYGHGKKLGLVSFVMSWRASKSLSDAIKHGRPPV